MPLFLYSWLSSLPKSCSQQRLRNKLYLNKANLWIVWQDLVSNYWFCFAYLLPILCYHGSPHCLYRDITKDYVTCFYRPEQNNEFGAEQCLASNCWDYYLVPKLRGFHAKKTTFPPEFCNEICTIYVSNIKNHSNEKNTCRVFVLFQFWPKFEKPLSQRKLSMKFGSK